MAMNLSRLGGALNDADRKAKQDAVFKLQRKSNFMKLTDFPNNHTCFFNFLPGDNKKNPDGAVVHGTHKLSDGVRDDLFFWCNEPKQTGKECYADHCLDVLIANTELFEEAAQKCIAALNPWYSVQYYVQVWGKMEEKNFIPATFQEIMSGHADAFPAILTITADKVNERVSIMSQYDPLLNDINQPRLMHFYRNGTKYEINWTDNAGGPMPMLDPTGQRLPMAVQIRDRKWIEDDYPNIAKFGKEKNQKDPEAIKDLIRGTWWWKKYQEVFENPQYLQPATPEFTPPQVPQEFQQPTQPYQVQAEPVPQSGQPVVTATQSSPQGTYVPLHTPAPELPIRQQAEPQAQIPPQQNGGRARNYGGLPIPGGY